VSGRAAGLGVMARAAAPVARKAAPGLAAALCTPERSAPGEMTHCLLLSGGLDSTTLAAWIREHHPGETVKAYTFLYGQKHAVELEAARTVAEAFGMEHQVIELPPIHGSALTDADAPLPEERDLATATGVAPSYVPARNLLFLAQMASLQDADGPAVLWLGVHHDDHTGYPDCRPEFVEAADQAVRLGTRYQLRVRAPFVDWSKADIIRWGLEHGVPYHLTYSCYQGRTPACGVCDTCQARLAAFAAAGVTDAIPYEKRTGRGGAVGAANAEPAGSGQARPGAAGA
jgi:7-cyano-7-deazaguanine synthase